jgi:hypothetical protein
MAKENEIEPSKVGIIPDFFHDIIAYIIPGYLVLILIAFNLSIINHVKDASFIKVTELKEYFLSLIVAYVIGRFFEQLGYSTIHHKKFPFIGKAANIPSPKWSLIFDEQDISYTEIFKQNVIGKIEAWLIKQNGNRLIFACNNNKKDDYFNLIQFWLRERFPNVALYEKKQNATIVLTRSLSMIFFINIPVFFVTFWVKEEPIAIERVVVLWLLANLLFSFFFYKRFQLDKKYHAMYIFETFIAMKKLLVHPPNDNNNKHNEKNKSSGSMTTGT